MQSQNTLDLPKEHLEIVATLTEGDGTVTMFSYHKTEGERSSIVVKGNSPKIIRRLIGILNELGE